MAQSYVVQGPTVLSLNSNGSGGIGAVNVGYTTNDDLFKISITSHMNPLFSTLTGMTPADFVNAGRQATISGTLSYWEPGLTVAAGGWLQTVLGPVMGVTSANETEGLVGDIGALYSSETTNDNPREFTLALTPSIDSQAGSLRYTYTFPRTLLMPGESITVRDMGNENMKIFCQFIALPNASGVLYTRTATSSG